MGNFFDDLGKAVSRAANSVSTEFNVAAQEQRLKEAYQALGRMYYEAVQAGKDVAGEKFDAQMAKIRDLQESIREMRRNQNVADV
jgi:hypothetical protein